MKYNDRVFFYDCEFIEAQGYLDLISIGFVSYDGKRELYLCNKDADLSRANDYVKENVIPKLPSYDSKEWVSYADMKNEILDFLNPLKESPVELWGYYADYDHVLLCWIFGRMIDLPIGMPMFTMDLRQEILRVGASPCGIYDGEHNALNDARWNRSLYMELEELEDEACVG